MAKATPPPEFGEIEPTKGPGQKPTYPNREAFESYMEAPPETSATPSQISPMELATPSSKMEPTPQNILSQIDNNTNLINDIQSKLQTPNLQIKAAHQRLLDSKLQESLKHIKKASDYLGAPNVELPSIDEKSTPLDKFVNYLGNGQDQMIEAKKKLEEMQKTEAARLSPADMMLVQVNLAQAQMQIEFSSVLLSKVVDALKQTLNIQL